SHTLHERGRVLARQNKMTEAIADFSSSIEKNRISARLFGYYLDRELAHEMRKDWPKAIADAAKAIELNPRSAAGYTARGNAYLGSENYDAAIKDQDKAIELAPKHFLAYLNRGVV